MIKENIVSFLELKRLLRALSDSRPDIRIKYRLMGEMWQTNFLTILKMTEKGAVFVHDWSKKLAMVDDLSTIMQFELDHTFQQYVAHYRYKVEPALVY